MANINTILETQHAIEATFLKKFSEFESKFKAAEPKSTTTLNRLHEEFNEFKTHVWTLLNFLREQVTEISKAVDVIEMRHRRKFLLLSGVPEETEDLPVYIANLFNEKLGICDLASTHLKACHRLGSVAEGKCRTILVRFADLSYRAAVWRKKAGFKGTPFVLSEFLTRQRQSLFVLARKKLGMKNCWTMGGNIVAKLPDGSRRHIYSVQDLDNIQVDDDLLIDEMQTKLSSPTPAAAVHSAQYLKTKRTVRKK